MNEAGVPTIADAAPAPSISVLAGAAVLNNGVTSPISFSVFLLVYNSIAEVKQILKVRSHLSKPKEQLPAMSLARVGKSSEWKNEK